MLGSNGDWWIILAWKIEHKEFSFTHYIFLYKAINNAIKHFSCNHAHILLHLFVTSHVIKLFSMKSLLPRKNGKESRTSALFFILRGKWIDVKRHAARVVRRMTLAGHEGPPLLTFHLLICARCQLIKNVEASFASVVPNNSWFFQEEVCDFAANGLAAIAKLHLNVLSLEIRDAVRIARLGYIRSAGFHVFYLDFWQSRGLNIYINRVSSFFLKVCAFSKDFANKIRFTH